MERKMKRLPEAIATLPRGIEQISKILWVVDPPSLMERLKDTQVINIAKIGIEARIQVLAVEKKMRALEQELVEIEIKNLTSIKEQLGGK